MNSKIRTPEQVREIGKQIVSQTEEHQRAKMFKMEEFLKQIENVDPSLGGAEGIGALLTLPDESFALLAPIFLDELEKSFNNTNDQLTMAQAMNVAGVRADDVLLEYEKICTQIDTDFEKLMSAQKRDFLKRILGLAYNALSNVEGASRRNITVPIELCSSNAKLPAYAHLTDAGADIYITEDISIAPGETKLISTDIRLAIPRGYAMMVYPRSGRSLNSKLRLSNCVGVIDSSYRGPIGIIADNVDPPIRSLKVDKNGKVSEVEYGSVITLSAGERVAQMVLTEIPHAVFYEVSDVSKYEGDGRGMGGYGSTGEN